MVVIGLSLRRNVAPATVTLVRHRAAAGALRAAMQDPQVKQRLAELSSDVPPLDKITPEGLRTHLEAEIKKWGPVIRKAGIYAD